MWRWYYAPMRYLVSLRLLPIFLLFALLPACHADGPAVVLKGESFSVELALDDATRAKGLMFRDEMPHKHGMLFVFDDLAPRSFWMKNTRIPLDIFYFDDQLTLVSVSENTRPCRTPRCPAYPSAGPAKYVLELNAGLARELEVKVGDKLELVGMPEIGNGNR